MTSLQVFAGGNTPQGFFNLFADFFPPEGQRLFLLKGGPGTGKSSLMRKLEDRLTKEGLAVERFLCGSDPKSLDAIYFPQIGVGMMDATSPHERDPRYPGAVDEILPLGNHWDGAALRKNAAHIRELSNAISTNFARSYRYLAACAPLQAQVHSLAADHLDLPFFQQLSGEITGQVLENADNAPGRIRHFMGSAIAAHGWVNELGNLTAMPKRMVLSSPFTGGWSGALGSLLAELSRLNIEVIALRDILDPHQIVHLYLPRAGFAILTSCPHHAIDSKPGDISYALPVPEGLIEESFALQTQNALLNQASSTLKEAMSLHDDLEGIYAQAMDFAKNDALADRLVQELLSNA